MVHAIPTMENDFARLEKLDFVHKGFAAPVEVVAIFVGENLFASLFRLLIFTVLYTSTRIYVKNAAGILCATSDFKKLHPFWPKLYNLYTSKYIVR